VGGHPHLWVVVMGCVDVVLGCVCHLWGVVVGGWSSGGGGGVVSTVGWGGKYCGSAPEVKCSILACCTF
jgi:hypothetical protein